MTTWTLQQVRDVQRLWVDLWVADEVVASSSGQAMEVARRKSGMALVDGARTFGVEAAMLDMAWDECRDEASMPFAVRVRARWEPSTRLVEMHGGAEDGSLIEVQDVEQPLVVAVAPPVNLAFLSSKATPTSPSFETLTYRLDGWNETHRRWVFRVSP